MKASQTNVASWMERVKLLDRYALTSEKKGYICRVVRQLCSFHVSLVNMPLKDSYVAERVINDKEK